MDRRSKQKITTYHIINKQTNKQMEHQGKSKKQLEFSYKAALVGFVGVLITFILHLIFN